MQFHNKVLNLKKCVKYAKYHIIIIGNTKYRVIYAAKLKNTLNSGAW